MYSWQEGTISLVFKINSMGLVIWAEYYDSLFISVIKLGLDNTIAILGWYSDQKIVMESFKFLD